MEAKGRFRVRVLPEIEPLKIVPVVPVARVVTTLSAEARPKVDVATHLVLVAVVWRIMPKVPVELLPSNKIPVKPRLVVEALVVETLEKVGVSDKVICVEVPINTCCPPVTERLEDETVRLPKVVVPIPPLLDASTPAHPNDKALLAIVPVTLVSLLTKPTSVVPRVEELVPPLATDNVPAQPSASVLLAIEPVIFVSLDVKPTKVVPRVEELVPPLRTGSIPETSAVREACPMFNSPPMDLTRPVPREAMVVEPSALTVNRLLPEEEAKTKMLLVEVAMF
jgi:hypothetical protein